MRARVGLLLGAVVAAGGAAAVAASGGVQGPQEEGAVEGFVAPVDVDTVGLPGPSQPVFFRHDIHAGQYQIDCQYCHVYVEVGPKPGIPPMSSCMGCHMIVARDNPEVQKLIEANDAGQPIEWVEIHRLAPFVHFPHHRHVVAGLECTTCHGPVERMPQIYQYASLKMGWCLTCHEERQVTTDCTACHY